MPTRLARGEHPAEWLEIWEDVVDTFASAGTPRDAALCGREPGYGHPPDPGQQPLTLAFK